MCSLVLASAVTEMPVAKIQEDRRAAVLAK